MLKRQRASSPSPLTQGTATEVPCLSSDPTSSEHGAKRRRRTLAPSPDGSSCGWDQPPFPLEVEADKDDIMGDGTSNPWASAGERRLGVAGKYKAVNCLLHDLHAEQQHRRLMSPSSHSGSSSPGPFSSNGWPSSAPVEPPAGMPDFTLHPHPNFIEYVPRTGKDSEEVLASETKNRLYHDNDVSVYDWYEETNRFLGSVFLERRRDLSAGL